MDMLDKRWDRIMDNPCTARQGDAIDPDALIREDAEVWNEIEAALLRIARYTLLPQTDLQRKSA